MLDGLHADARAIGHAQGQAGAIVAGRAILDLDDGLEIKIEALLLELGHGRRRLGHLRLHGRWNVGAGGALDALGGRARERALRPFAIRAGKLLGTFGGSRFDRGDAAG